MLGIKAALDQVAAGSDGTFVEDRQLQAIGMRLINTARTANTSRITFEEFIGTPPTYAILSHTWGKEEITLQDALGNQDLSKFEGYQKIQNTCKLANDKRIPYAWVDTCCIDKSSSAELSESINSMFKWYEGAKITYAHIADWQADQELREYRWFSRGWTLQELVAPAEVEFYDADWTLRGTKSSLVEELSKITGISTKCLKDVKACFDIPICTRMSWAAYRSTSRVEDIAYSLLGLFDVNMSMLYGEGSKAFIRLQKEILTTTRDLSLFAWCENSAKGNVLACRGIFARSPSEFANVPDVQLDDIPKLPVEMSLTNYGLRIMAKLYSSGTVLSLNVAERTSFNSNRRIEFGICVRRSSEGTYMRVQPWMLALIDPREEPGKISKIYLETDFASEIRKLELRPAIINFDQIFYNAMFRTVFAEPNEQWDDDRQVFLFNRDRKFLGCVAYVATPRAGKDFEGVMFWVVCKMKDITNKSREPVPFITLATQETNPDIFVHSGNLPLVLQLIGEEQRHQIFLKSRSEATKSTIKVTLVIKFKESTHGWTIIIALDYQLCL